MSRPFRDDLSHDDLQSTVSNGQSTVHPQGQFFRMKRTATALKFEQGSGRNISQIAPIKLTLRKFLRAHTGLSVVPTLLRVNEWLASIHSGKLEKPSPRRSTDAGHHIEFIAEGLITKASGTERSLLSKSLQEALYYAVRFDASIGDVQLRARLSEYVARWGAAAFLRRFLSLFFFNFVQFETGESFRGLARNPQRFEKYIEDLDYMCHQTVASVWKSFERTKRPLDLFAASELVQQIEQRLRGI